jgi:hypothetical protein
VADGGVRDRDGRRWRAVRRHAATLAAVLVLVGTAALGDLVSADRVVAAVAACGLALLTGVAASRLVDRRL